MSGGCPHLRERRVLRRGLDGHFIPSQEPVREGAVLSHRPLINCASALTITGPWLSSVEDTSSSAPLRRTMSLWRTMSLSRSLSLPPSLSPPVSQIASDTSIIDARNPPRAVALSHYRQSEVCLKLLRVLARIFRTIHPRASSRQSVTVRARALSPPPPPPLSLAPPPLQKKTLAVFSALIPRTRAWSLSSV